MNDSLPPDLQDFVAAKLATGQFRTVDEVAIAALRRLRDAEEQHLAELRSALQHAQSQIERGECITLEGKAAIDGYFNSLKRRVPGAGANYRRA